MTRNCAFEGQRRQHVRESDLMGREFGPEIRRHPGVFEAEDRGRRLAAPDRIDNDKMIGSLQGRQEFHSGSSAIHDRDVIVLLISRGRRIDDVHTNTFVAQPHIVDAHDHHFLGCVLP